MRPIQWTRPPRASTPLATAASQMMLITLTCSACTPMIRMPATPEIDSSVRIHDRRGAESWTTAVATITAKPTIPAIG